MEFGWISLFGAAIVLIVTIPDLVFSLQSRKAKDPRGGRGIRLMGLAGRLGCMVLAWLPFPAGKFGFSSVEEFLLYLAGSGFLLAAYLFAFCLWLRERTPGRTLVLAALPPCVFLLSGILLRHWLLAAFSLLFAAGRVRLPEGKGEAPRQGSQDASRAGGGER